jgi:hypothetical protein
MADIKDKYVEVFRIQISKLEEDDFDLEAWKSGTIVLLARVFGDDSSKISEIEKIKFDFGSWSLRDSSGSADQMEACKKRCMGVLEACITELDVLGVEEEFTGEVSNSKLFQALRESIEEELKMSQYKKLLKIIKTKSSREEKQKMLFNSLMSYDPGIASKIIANILTQPSLSKSFLK